VARHYLSFVIFLLLSFVALSQDRTHDVTIDDYFTLAAVTEIAISPDGKHVAYAEARWQQSTNDRKADLWVVSTNGNDKPRRLTMDRVGASSLKWSDDNKSVYYLANSRKEGEKQPPNDGSTQVWKTQIGNGATSAVTRVAGGISSFDLVGNLLYYTIEKTVADHDDFSALRGKYALMHGHGTRRVSQLSKLDLESWHDSVMLDNSRHIREFTVTRDGKHVAMITTPDDTVITFEGRSRVDVFEIASGAVSTLPDKVWRADSPSPYAWLENVAWSPDGKHLAFVAVFDGFPAEIIVTSLGEKQPASHKMRRPKGMSIHGYGTPLVWRNATTLCYFAEMAAQVHIGQYELEHEAAIWQLGDGAVVSAISFSAEGDRTVVLYGDRDKLPELYMVSSRDSRPMQLTNLNPHTAAWKLPKIRHETWKSADGTTVGGILELPPDYKEGQKFPLVVGIHGGPTTAVYTNLEFNMYEGRLFLPAQGYAVLCPNYRGSTGYGDKFLTELIGRENELDVADILAGVDHLVKRGIADPDRLAVMGWSNGGYLTNCLITKTNRFKAASSGASILDTVIEWGTNDEPAYPWVFKKGHPWETPDTYRKTSPTYDLGKVKTPTLIHVGQNDERCPPGHSRMLYRALREFVKVPCELVIYPGEPHGLGRYSHRKAKMEWDAAWFDKYLKGSPRPGK